MTKVSKETGLSARRRDRRLPVLLGTLGTIVLLGALIYWVPQQWMLLDDDIYVTKPEQPAAATVEEASSEVDLAAASQQDWSLKSAEGAADNPAGHAWEQLDAQTRILFEHGVSLMGRGELEQASRALTMVVEIRPDLPEAHVNLGFLHYEMAAFQRAKTYFRTAIELNPGQANAYYGLAMAHEAQGDLESALGAMRSFIHLAREHEAFVPKARAAIWEWGEQLDKLRAQRNGQGDPSADAEEGLPAASNDQQGE